MHVFQNGKQDVVEVLVALPGLACTRLLLVLATPLGTPLFIRNTLKPGRQRTFTERLVSYYEMT